VVLRVPGQRHRAFAVLLLHKASKDIRRCRLIKDQLNAAESALVVVF
jgi:hypothetical protein